MLTGSVAITPASRRKPRVGDRVTFTLGRESVVGKITEDRGPIGVGKRRLYRIEVEVDPEYRAAFELPASDFTVESRR